MRIAVTRRLTYVVGFAFMAAAVALFVCSKRWGLKRSESLDIVEENSLASFPASDPPSWNPPGGLRRHHKAGHRRAPPKILRPKVTQYLATTRKRLDVGRFTSLFLVSTLKMVAVWAAKPPSCCCASR